MDTKRIIFAGCMLAALCPALQGRVINGGGSGPYKAEAVTAADLAGHTIYRPQDLAKVNSEEGQAPVMIWVNGAQSGTLNYENVLNEIASNGYVVIDAANSAASVNEAITWAGAQSRAKAGEYAGLINGLGVALGGKPSAAVVQELMGSRGVRTMVLANTAVAKSLPKDALQKFRGSILYVTGGETASAAKAARKDFDAIAKTSAQAVIAQVDKKHNASSEDYFAGIVNGWLDWTLRSDRDALDLFREDAPADYPGCAISAANLPPYEYEYPSAHDPVVAFCDGRYYVFTTGMGVMSSADLKSWKFENNVLKSTPEWAVKKGFRGMPWAPDIQYINGKWYIYYSYSGFGKNKSAIGVAINKTLNPKSPDFKWEDQGMIVESVPGRDEWNAIDANVFVDDDGTGWLTFGSFWRGIKTTKLNEDYTRLADPQEWYPVSRRPEGTAPETVSTDTAVSPDPRGKDFDAGNGAVEAPFVIKRNGKYYLFVSFDLCCRGAKSTYNVVVGRADKVTGPYYDKNGVDMIEGGGTLVVGGNERFAGAGHCAVTSINGEDYIFMHGYDSEYDYGSRLLIKKIDWSADGWPSVEL